MSECQELENGIGAMVASDAARAQCQRRGLKALRQLITETVDGSRLMRLTPADIEKEVGRLMEVSYRHGIEVQSDAVQPEFCGA